MPISSAVDPSARARVLGIKTEFRNLAPGNPAFLPQRVALIGQGATAATYDTAKVQYFTAFDVGTAYGFGSPVHLAAMQLQPTNGDGIGTIPLTVYPLEDDGSGVASAGDITPTVGSLTEASYKVRVNNIDSEAFIVEVGDAVADVTAKMVTAINAVLEMPVIASDGTTTLDVASKWKGASANDIVLEVVGPTDAGMTWAFTQPVNGANNPDVQDALDLIGDVWETMVLNCMDVADTDTLDTFQTFGDGRWGPLVRKPLLVFTGNTATTVAAAIAVPDARKTDKVNAQLVAPGSNDLPFVVAARQLARIVKQANTNPPVDYARQGATGLVAGADGDQWTATQRDAALKGGSSTVEIIDGVVNLSDTVTFYHPTGDPNPAYRYVVSIVRLQTIIYNTELAFNTPDWAGAPLIPDDQPTTNSAAKKPKMAVALVSGLIDGFASQAIISDPETAKQSILAGISATNPNRLDISYAVALSGNTNIISIDLFFGFYFGTEPVVG